MTEYTRLSTSELLEWTGKAAKIMTERNWRQLGITPDKHLDFYCGTGWRGSEALFNAWLMDLPRVSVFDGGWFEWSNDPKKTYEKGDPEKYIPRDSKK